MNKRIVIAKIVVDDDMAIDEGIGTLDYLQREFGWIEESGIYLGEAKILDGDDPEDANAIELAKEIFDN